MTLARRTPRRSALILLVPLALGACTGPGGCSKSNPGAAGAGPSAAESFAPVPAPDGLLADLIVPSPDAMWTKARALVGGPAMFMPQNFGVLTTTLLKLPVLVAGEIDGSVPVVGALIKKGADPSRLAIGIHVKSGDRFLDQITKGQDARFVTTQDEASHIRWLTPKDAPSTGEAAFAAGVLGNYLLVGKSIADLQAVGPYVARTLSMMPPPKEDVALEIGEAALKGSIVESLRRQMGRARELAESAGPAVLPITSALDTAAEVLGDAKHARVTIELDAEAAHARVAVTPSTSGGPASKALASLTVGDTLPVLELPANTLIGVAWREAAASRTTGVPAQADALAKLVAKDMPAPEKAAITSALAAEAEARGDWVALGVALDATGPSASLRAPIGSDEKMRKALKQLVDLFALPTVKARLKEAALDVTAGKAVVENLAGDVQRIRFERLDKGAQGRGEKGSGAKPGAPDGSGIPRTIDVLYLVTADALFGAVGLDPASVLRSAVKAPTGDGLATNAPFKRALQAVGSDAAFTLVLDPVRILAARAGKPAPSEVGPVVLALGRTKGDLWGRLDVSAIALHQLAEQRGGF